MTQKGCTLQHAADLLHWALAQLSQPQPCGQKHPWPEPS
ncbi:hypothetical protein SynWH8101_0792 [Synechococcus sp. WH 8101]|nr:hypothetical protein SynWH8101_0792 [Synechococcus sp. WH 8101]QNI44594.1 hypothetical protein SynRCC2555_00806 [Synechococcus sp. WH 8101]